MYKSFSRLAKKFPEDVTFVSYNDGTVSVSIIESGKRNNYGTLKKSYNKSLKDFYTAVLVLLEKPEGPQRTNEKGELRTIKTVGKVYGQTHEGGGSNVKHQINDAVYAAMEVVNKTSGEAVKEISQQLEELNREDANLILSIIKSGNLGEVNYGISSALLNSRTGAGIEEQGMKIALNKAIISLQAHMNIINVDGSDSLLKAHRKKIVKEVVKPFKNKKGLKVKHEDVEIKEGGKVQLKKPGGKLIVPAGVAGKIVAKKKLRRTHKGKAKAPRMALQNILGLINAKLPQQVADNMGSPRLENRTGRFAQSVQAIDVQDTAKGFKSIGYTYQKGPYQAFESTSGTRFSSVARDPRTLIDLSIREIVAQFGLGRLYTRRL